MAKTSLALSLLLSLSFSLPVLADTATRDFTDTDFLALPAIALVDNTSALPLNPAAAGAQDLFEVFLSKSIDPNVSGHAAAFVGLPNLSLGFQQFQTNVLGDLRKFSAAYNYAFTDYLSFGVGYNLSQQVSVADSNIHSFDMGLLIRPARFLSFGASIRNLNAPTVGNTQIQRAYALGVGVRPFGERFTLTADTQWDEGDSVQQITGRFGVEAEPVDGLLVRGSVDLLGQFTLGAGFQFDTFGAGYFHGFNAQGKARDAAEIQVTSAHFQNALKQLNHSFAYLDLSQGVAMDQGQSGDLFTRGGPPGYWQVIEQLKLVRNAPRYQGLVIDVGAMNVGLGMVEELRSAIQAVRDAGKQVIVYLNDGGIKEYYLASAADKVAMHPMGSLRLNGLAFVMPYYKNVLDLVGVGVDFIKVGKYKTGLESYTRTEASPPTQEQYKAVQNNEFERFKNTLMTRRNLKDKTFDGIMTRTLFSARDAKEAGLVDNIVYRDELGQMSADLIHQPKVEIEDLRVIRVHNESWEPRNKIGVIYVSGGITEGPSSRDFLFGETSAGSSSIVKQIYAARENPQIKGLVLRINSPGGSALASDEIYRALIRYKETTKNPVIVSMADVAASGGYWIAMAGDEILANPSTITGSIGIYAGKVNLERLYERLGVEHTIIKTNPKADQNGTHRAYTEEERKVIQDNLLEFYRIFIDRVSKGRNLDIKQVEEVAQGRIYTGDQALKIKLVDSLGDLSDAIARAKALADIKTADVGVVHFSQAGLALESLAGVQAALDLGQDVAKKGVVGSAQESVRTWFPHQNAVLAIMDPRWGK